MSDVAGQATSFLMKKANYYATLAAQHMKDGEADKAKTLYRNAAQWYRKAGAEDKAKECESKL